MAQYVSIRITHMPVLRPEAEWLGYLLVTESANTNAPAA